ncbi:hypothetical protein WKI72_16995 [Candidatus Erwinia dacicola]
MPEWGYHWTTGEMTKLLTEKNPLIKEWWIFQNLRGGIGNGLQKLQSKDKELLY